MRETPHWAGNVVGPDSAISAAIPSGAFLSVSSASSGSDPPSLGGGDVSSPCSPLATQNFLGRDVPAPIHTINYFGVGDVSSPHSHAFETNTPWDETSQPLSFWDETSQPPSRPSITSELVINSALPLPVPNPSSKP